MKPRKILHVEDDLDIQVIVQMSLETIGGFELAQCSNGQEAIEQAPAFDPDLVLLDVMMPGMDGEETLRELRKLEGFRTTPVIFMTAKAQEDVISDLLKQGAIGVITKPFDPMELSDQILDVWSTMQAA